MRRSRRTDAWEQRKLSEISEKVSKKNQDMVVDEVFTNSAEFGIISQRDYFDKDIANSENIDGYYIVEPNDFVYNPRISTLAPFGPVRRNKLDKSGAMSPLYYVFRTHDVDCGYLEYFFKTNRWHSFMHLNGNSGARSDRFAIRDEVFRDMPISMPQDIEEQKNVGDFFSTLELAITLHQRKCDALQKFKKSMLQKMFPQNGESVPEIRFAGFTDAWEQRKLGELGEVITGSTPSTSHEEYYSADGIPWVTPTDITENVIYDTPRKLSDEGQKVGRVVPKGTILVTCIASIGKNTILGTTGSFNQQINGLVPDFNKFVPYFLFTESTLWSEKMKRQAAAGTMQIVNKTEFSELETSVPNYKEQEKIGTFFSNLDTLITLHQRKLETLQKMKKSLLQKMFV